MDKEMDQKWEDCGSEGAEEKTETAETWKDLESFLAVFLGEGETEKKIALAIDFMQTRLSSFTSPKFREFWEIRKLCLPLFKENISSKVRAPLWRQYVDLAMEARRMKEILDEKSSFAYEQIDLAIESILVDLSKMDLCVADIPPIEIPEAIQSLQAKKEKYIAAQKHLHFLHVLATRIHALRKEVIKMDMKIRSKNKLFEKLSICGDAVFPKRKEWIKTISEDFVADIAQFWQRNFTQGKPPKGSLFFLREEVKALQSLAKVLTLNTYAFTESRMQLSRCWDVLRQWELEKKQEMEGRKAEYQKQFDSFSPQVEEFVLWCGSDATCEEVEVKGSGLLSALRGLEIDRLGRQSLEEKILTAIRPHAEKRRSILEAMQEKERQIEAERAQKIQDLHKAIEMLLERAETLESQEFEEARSNWEEGYRKAQCLKGEKTILDRLHRKLQDKMLDMKKRSLLSMSQGEREVYVALQELLLEKKKRRTEIRLQLEIYRKLLGGSTLDFEKALQYQELMAAEKSSLEQITLAIEEIEEKLEEVSV